jgi:hypothetical protein
LFLAYIVIAEKYKMSRKEFDELSFDEIEAMYHYTMYLNNRDREIPKK